MDTQLLKYHLEELKNMIETDPLAPFPVLIPLYRDAFFALSKEEIKQIKTSPLQIIEKLLKQIRENPECPKRMKARIAKVQQEMARIFDELNRNPHN